MYYIYILYSETSDKYYVGYTSNIEARMHQHNHQEHFNTFTRKHRPWKLKSLFEVSENEKAAIAIERFIKKQHSKNFIERIISPHYKPVGILAQLVRVPQLRD